MIFTVLILAALVALVGTENSGANQSDP